MSAWWVTFWVALSFNVGFWLCDFYDRRTINLYKKLVESHKREREQLYEIIDGYKALVAPKEWN